jgi:lipopolysaccharide export system protein LptC
MTQLADEMRDRRKAFALPGGAHDRLIHRLNVILPAAVGVVAALMIITPLSPRGEVSFLLDRNKVEVAKDRLRVDNAMYRGQDDKGRPFSLVAGEALQRSVTVPVVRLSNLSARMLLSEGPALLTAAGGSYNIDTERVAVDGVVRFTAADGYRMTASGVSIDMPTRRVIGAGRVEGAIPAGTFSADRIEADLGERTISLDGNARLHMTPGKLRMP